MKTFDDVCYKASSNVSQNQLNDEVGIYPIFGASGKIKNVSFYHHDKPYLSIVKDGSGVGRVTKMDAFSSVIGTLQYILPKENIDIDYLYYSLISIDFKKYVAGAAIPHIYFKDYKNEPFLWTPIQEQKRIVAILDKAFEQIAIVRANTEKNLQNTRALFESHLQNVFSVRGEPVEPQHPSTSSGRTCGGWEVKRFNDVLEIKNGKDQKPVEKTNGQYPIYGSAGNVMGWTDAYICEAQTTIIGRKGTINKPIFIETRFWNVDTAFGLSAKPVLNPKFLYFFCLSYDFSSHNRGTTIPSLVKTDLLEIKISIPSLSKQEDLVREFSKLQDETQRLESLYQRKLNALDTLKKSLLHQAFAGEL